MEKHERRWAFWFGFAVMLVTSIPYLLGYMMQGEAFRFTGFVIGVEDGNSYIAKMLSGWAGNWLFFTPYTAMAQSGFLAFFPYILLGKLVAPPAMHEQLVALFHLYRFAAGIVLVVATYDFMTLFTPVERWRRVGTALACCGGGLGWLAFLGLGTLWGGRVPLEYYSPETFGFLSIFSLPHLALARALLLWGLLFYFRNKRTSTPGAVGVKLGLFWLGLGLLQPLTVLIGWMVVALDGLVDLALMRAHTGRIDLRQWFGIHLKLLGVAALLSLPIVIYTFFSFTYEPFLKAWASQNIIMSPPPGDYLLAYAPVLPFIVLGYWGVWKKRRQELYPLALWGLLIPCLAYFPYVLQRRLPEGTWVALAGFCVLGMAGMSRKWRSLANLAIGISLFSTGFVLLGGGMTAVQVKLPVFVPAESVRAYEYLQRTAKGFPVVIASYDHSNALPAWAPVRTVIGHGPESIGLATIQPKVEAFLSGNMDPDTARAFLRETKARYILIDNSSAANGWSPDVLENVNLVYTSANCLIYEIIQ